MLFSFWPSREKLKREKRKEENEGSKEDEDATQKTQKNRDAKRKTGEMKVQKT